MPISPDRVQVLFERDPNAPWYVAYMITGTDHALVQAEITEIMNMVGDSGRGFAEFRGPYALRGGRYMAAGRVVLADAPVAS